MKTDVMPSRVRVEPDVLKSLVNDVKETVAKDFPMPQTRKRRFGITDLWNIRRNSRSAQQRF